MNPKRLVFCTTPCVYSSLALNTLIESPDVEVVAIISSTRNLHIKENSWASSFKRITQSGLRYSCYLWFITQGHTLFSRWSKLPSTEVLATSHNIPNYKTGDINSEKMRKTLRQLSPDILLCAHFNQRIAPEIYSLAKDSAVNIHPSLLPDLRGVDPAFYALLEGHQETGVSLHHLDETFDTGSIIAQQQYQIQRTDSLFALNYKLFCDGINLFINYLGNKNEDIIEKATNGRYDSWPTTPQVKAFGRDKKLVSFQDIKWLFHRDK